MVTWCGRLFSARMQSALNFLEPLARARAFELLAAAVYQANLVNPALPPWFFG